MIRKVTRLGLQCQTQVKVGPCLLETFASIQAGAELGHAQLKLVFGFTSVYLYYIDELEILLARLTPTSICHLAQVEHKGLLVSS